MTGFLLILSIFSDNHEEAEVRAVNSAVLSTSSAVSPSLNDFPAKNATSVRNMTANKQKTDIF